MPDLEMSTLTGVQVRCARTALGWSLAQLAKHSGVSMSTIRRVEAKTGAARATAPNLKALRMTLEAAGIEFIGSPEEGPGIRLWRQGQDTSPTGDG